MREPAELGRKAEERAAAYAASLGWRVLARNVTNRYGELDIVAMDDAENELVVIEVRYRTIGDVQSPLDSVGPRKLRTLINAGRALVNDIGWTGFWRIDLVGVTADRFAPESQWRLEHIKDITRGMDVP